MLPRLVDEVIMGYVFPMALWSEFRMGQFKDIGHWELQLQFRQDLKNIFSYLQMFSKQTSSKPNLKIYSKMQSFIIFRILIVVVSNLKIPSRPVERA